jgi:hypothetical protein
LRRLTKAANGGPALWSLAAPETVGGTGTKEWARPEGAHDAYSIGDKIMFEGAEYESATNGNVFSPAEYPAGWTLAGE